MLAAVLFEPPSAETNDDTEDAADVGEGDGLTTLADDAVAAGALKANATPPATPPWRRRLLLLLRLPYMDGLMACKTGEAVSKRTPPADREVLTDSGPPPFEVLLLVLPFETWRDASNFAPPGIASSCAAVIVVNVIRVGDEIPDDVVVVPAFAPVMSAGTDVLLLDAVP